MNSWPFSIYDFFAYLSSGFVVLVVADHSFYRGSWLQRDLGGIENVLLVVVAYVVGHLVSHVASYFIESRLLHRHLGPPEVTLFEEPSDRRRSRIFSAYYRPLPEENRRQVIARARADAEISEPGRALFLYCWSHVRRDQITLSRLNSFLNQYGFARNMVGAASISVLFIILGEVFGVTAGTFSDNVVLGLGALVVAVGMLFRYLKFFRLFTIEVFLQYAASGEGR